MKMVKFSWVIRVPKEQKVKEDWLEEEDSKGEKDNLEILGKLVHQDLTEAKECKEMMELGVYLE